MFWTAGFALLPVWLVAQPWLLALQVVSLSLCTIYFAEGRSWLGPLAFSTCSILAPVVWLAVVQGLTGASATMAAASSVSLFSASDTPRVLSVNDSNPIELGVKFQSSQAGTILGIRFYKGPSNVGTHVGDVWTNSGMLLTSATFSNESSSGWQQVSLSNPVPISPNTIYIVSYHTSGHYSADNDYFDTNPKTNGPLRAPATGSITGGNGVFGYGGTSTFPKDTFRGNNYWVDVVFKPGLSRGNQPPIADDDSGFVTNENTPLTIPASQLLANDSDPNGNPDSLKIQSVSNPTNGIVTCDSGSQRVTFTPADSYTGPAGFVYTITNGFGTASATVSLTVSAPGTTSSLFSTGSTPGTITVNDANAVELGVKFQSSVAGNITAIRFYKGTQNTGTHTAHLWSAGGTSLASATFSGETASGWQQVNLPSPVAITANTTYVVSYHTSTGFYSADNNYFAGARTNGSLTATGSSSSGGNGVFSYGSTGTFPTNTHNATNYWVDVVFVPN